MALMNPTALLYALLIGALVLIHFRRRSRTTLRVSNLQLWQAATLAREAQPILDRPRADWLLAVQALFLAAVILALTQPVVWIRGAQPRTVVLVMDCSASMNARERGGTRFDLARAKARALVDHLGSEDRVLLVEARSRPVMRAYPGSDRAAVGRALEALGPTRAPSDVNEAVLLALAAVPKGEPAEVFVFSDGTRNALVSDKPLAGRVRYVQTGETDGNLAVTRLAVRSNPLSAHDSELLAEVTNLSSQPRECRLELRMEEDVLLDRTANLVPREKKAYVIALPAGREGVIRATIHADDDLDVDNQADAVAGRRKLSVLLVTEGNLFLEKGLQVNPQVIGTIARPEEWTAASRERYDVVILDGFVPPVLPPANYLVVRYGQPATLLRGIREPVLLRPEHPVTSLVDLSDVVIEQATSVEVPPSGVALMAGNGHPLIVASEAGAFRTVELGFDVRASNLPLTPSFPVLLANALQWLGSSSAGEGGQIAGLLDAVESDIRPVAPANDPAPRLAPPAQQARAGLELHMALLFVACVLWASEWLYSSRRKARVRWSWFLKAATALFLALAVSGVKVPATSRAAAVVFVVDRSESVAQTEQTAAMEYLAGALSRLPGDAEAGVVVFASEAVVEHPLTRGLSVGDIQSSPAATRSDVARGLSLARSMLAGRPDAVKRIVLLSDGNQNVGDALREAALAAMEEIAVDVVPLRTAAEVSGRKVFLQDASGPNAVRLGEPFDLRITLRGVAKSEAVLRVLRDGTLRSTHRAVLASQGPEVLRIPERISEPGFHQYRIVIEEPGGTNPAPVDQAGVVVYAHGRAAVLHVTEHPFGLLDSILERQGFRVVVSPPGSAATLVSNLSRYDVTILDNVPARMLGEEWMRAMAAHVEQDAGGLIMIGGAGSFGPGGFAGGPVERVLPVDMVRRDREKKPALAVVVVLDKSGSMGMEQRKVSKIDMAKDAVLRLSELLTADDALGIIAFDRSPREVLPLRPGVSPASVEASIRGLTGGGGTAMLPAVELAYQWLAASGAEKKHILLLSDGQAEPAERDPLLERVSGSTAVLSTVGIGGDVDRGFMEALASAAHGRTYFTESGTDLSDILKREGVLIAGRWLVERLFTPRQASAHEILQNLGETGVPMMAGYVATTPKPLAEVVLTSDTGDPILACWRAGLGKTVVFTSALPSTWTRRLVAWEHFGRLWAQMVRWASRGLQSESLRARVRWDGGAATLVVDSFDRTGRFGNLLSVGARMQTPDGRSVDIDLSQTAPGSYEGPFDYSGKGSYFITVTARDPISGAESTIHLGSDLSRLPEDRSMAADGAFLAAVASAGRGSVLDRTAREQFSATGPPGYSEAWPIAAVLAMLFFLLDVAVRRGWKLNLGSRRS